MELPSSFKSLSANFDGGFNLPSLKLAAHKLSESYLNEDNKQINHISGDLYAYAYLLTRMPATYQAFSTSFLYAKDLVDLDFKTVLDVGSGLGVVPLTMHELGINCSITCIEKNEHMINLANKIFYEYGVTNFIYKKEDILHYETKDNFDLITASYCLNEFKESDYLQIVHSLYERTNKYLLIVEPGTPKGFDEINKIRTFLLNLGAYIVAPCPHLNICPMKDNDWCHFEKRIARDKLHKTLKEGESPFEDEKFSYLFISKIKPEINAYNRVIRHPFFYKGYIKFQVCTPVGEYKEITISKSQTLYKEARKKNAGDIL